MSWTKSICYFAFCALLAAPAMAAPSLNVGLNPGLSASGGFVWNIGVTPDTALFSDPADSPDRGNGGTTAIDVGFTLTGLNAAAAVKNATNFDTDTPGNSTFGDETADGDGDFVGVQIGSNASNVYAGLGSVFFTSGGVKQALSITTAPLTIASPTSTIAWGGAYNASGAAGTTHGIIAQDGSHFGVAGSASYTATSGDADLTGGVSLDDFTTVLFNFGTGTTWTQGNFDGDASTDLDDFTTVLFNFGNASGSVVFSGALSGLSSVTVPEPASCIAMALGCIGIVGLRRRRQG